MGPGQPAFFFLWRRAETRWRELDGDGGRLIEQARIRLRSPEFSLIDKFVRSY